MYQVFESIKVLNGKAFNLPYHKVRMAKTAHDLWGIEKSYDIDKELLKLVPKKGLFKIKVKYHLKKGAMEIIPYTPKSTVRLFCIRNESIEYPYKYIDRSLFDRYLKNLNPNDDILFVKNNRFTDTSYANIAMWNGEEWHTPSTPLLYGTKRQLLIDTKKIIPQDITIDQLKNYQKISLINAMLDLNEMVINVDDLSIH